MPNCNSAFNELLFPIYIMTVEQRFWDAHCCMGIVGLLGLSRPECNKGSGVLWVLMSCVTCMNHCKMLIMLIPFFIEQL